MISQISLAHFKAFGERFSTSLAPITLLYGANSSGKSSLLQSLMILKQTIGPTNTSRTPLAFAGPTEFGGYRSLVFKHDTTQSIFVGVGITKEPSGQAYQTMEPPSPVYVGFVYGLSEDERVILKEFTVSSTAVDEPEFVFRHEIVTMPSNPLQASSSRPYTTYTLHSIASDSQTMHRYFTDFMAHDQGTMLQHLRQHGPAFLPYLTQQLQADSARRSEQPAERDFTAEARQMLDTRIATLENYSIDQYRDDCYAIDRGYALALDGLAPYQFVPFEPNNLSPFRWEAMIGVRAGFVVDALALAYNSLQQLTAQLTSLTHVGPLRQAPKRIYIYGGDAPLNVGRAGEQFADALFANRKYEEAVNRLCELMELGFRVKLTQSSREELSQAFAITLYDEVIGSEVALYDVGFGVPQVLPILLQIAMTHQSALLIEQPEVHLNPRLQASLGTVLSVAVNEDPSRQIIVETHSEHLLLRLQGCIRRGELRPELLKVLFVSRDASGSHVQELRLDQRGEMIGGWPNGFFEETLTEMLRSGES